MTAHFFLFLFTVLVSIILMNLLVGLAVSDIQGLSKSARLHQLIQQVLSVQYILSRRKLIRRFCDFYMTFQNEHTVLKHSNIIQQCFFLFSVIMAYNKFTDPENGISPVPFFFLCLNGHIQSH